MFEQILYKYLWAKNVTWKKRRDKLRKIRETTRKGSGLRVERGTMSPEKFTETKVS